MHTSAIIYRLVDTIRTAVADLLPKMIETRVHGEALVQQVFEISVKGRKEPMKVAGCKVGNGVFQKARKARVVRRGEVLHTGEWFLGAGQLGIPVYVPGLLTVGHSSCRFCEHT